MINNTDEQRKMEIEDMINALKKLGNEATLEQKAKAMEDARKRRQAPISYLLGVLLCACAPGPEGIRPVFDPSPEIAAYTDAMTVRLARATGRTDIAVEAGGIPVEYREDLESLREDGEMDTDCGQTVVTTQEGVLIDAVIYIDPTPPDGCPPAHVTLVHEGIHALAPDAKHTDDGIFHKHAVKSFIDEVSLGELCSHFDCLAFVPEL